MNLTLLFNAIAAASAPAADQAVDTASKFFNWGGAAIALIGAAIAVVLAGIGSAIAVKNVASAGIGLLSEDPRQFMPALVLSLLPSTQGIYGFVIAFMMLGKVTAEMNFTSGFSLMLAGLPIGIVGFMSAIFQGKVAASGIQLAAKQPKHWSRAMILTLLVEMFALLSFIISIFMVNNG